MYMTGFGSHGMKLNTAKTQTLVLGTPDMLGGLLPVQRLGNWVGLSG